MIGLFRQILTSSSNISIVFKTEYDIDCSGLFKIRKHCIICVPMHSEPRETDIFTVAPLSVVYIYKLLYSSSWGPTAKEFPWVGLLVAYIFTGMS